MTIRKLALLSVLLVASGLVKAQKKTFVMPPNINYLKGALMVKVKNEFKEEFIANSSARVKSLPLKSMRPMVHPKLAQKGAAWRGPLAVTPKVDIARYFKVSYDASKDIESYINELYKTGYFEIIEPVYERKTSFTTNDPSVAKQYYLTTIKAIQAWDISQGSADMTIAIVDTGGNLTHTDLAGNLYVNTKDPVNGVDDDNDGFIDNNQGWDFIGADTLNLTRNFAGDNDPSVHEGGDINHGTWVAGCASASTNNGIGIAGVGFKTKLMFTKHTADNQLTSNSSIYFGYDGVIYAANQGIKIINTSWGGPGSSQIEQDLVNYVTVDLGCLWVAAAGNGGNSDPSYPGAYDNVLSAAATDKNDLAASFTTYGPTVDVSAPGVDIYSTGFDNVYNTISGTSFSSPITAGAAALVWAHNPTWTPQQVAQQLRVTSDAKALYTANPTLIGQLGYGRLDIQAALTTSMPALRAANPKFLNASGLAVQPGESGFLTFDFTDYLKSTSSGLSITLTTTSGFATITKGSITPGIIQSGQTVTNSLSPFLVSINKSVPENTTIDFTITYSDGSYNDTQVIETSVNPSFLDINSNQVTTTISEIGRLGYQDPSTPAMGSGFLFNQNQMMSEIGLIMGTSATNLFNNDRGVLDKSTGIDVNDDDFDATTKMKEVIPGVRSNAEIFGEFSNSTQAAQQAVVVDYRSLVWKDAPYDKFVIFEYKIKNPTATAITGFYFGMFADWDITDQGAFDAADWYPQENMGYIYPAQPSAKPYAGTQLLTGPANYYAIDNNPPPNGPTAPFWINDGWTDVEKFTTISTSRLQAGMSTTTGNDVSHVVAAGPFNIPAGGSITVAYALHAANNLADLKTSSAYADTLYNLTLNAPRPVVDTVKICYNSPATISASGAGKLNWYKTFTGGTPFFTGSQYISNALTSDTTFYVSNADQSYESVRTPAVVILKAKPTIITSGSTTFCEGQSISLSVAAADSYLWSTGEKTQTIQVTTADVFSVTVTNTALGCSSNSNPVTTVVNTPPTAKFTSGGTLKEGQTVTFTDQSSASVSWFWQFGDDGTSSDQNPSHVYATGNNYSVSLTVTDAKGCQSTATNTLSVITGLEDPFGIIAIYPNPVHGQPITVEVNEKEGTYVKLTMINLLGVELHAEEFQTTGQKMQREIAVKNLPDGIYIIQVNAGDRFVAKKIVKADQ